MDIVNQDVEMISLFKSDGEPKPIRLRIADETGELQVYPIQKILSKGIKKIDKQNIWVFNCLIIINGMQRLCEIRYILSETKWVLYRI